MFEFIYTF